MLQDPHCLLKAFQAGILAHSKRGRHLFHRLREKGGCKRGKQVSKEARKREKGEREKKGERIQLLEPIFFIFIIKTNEKHSYETNDEEGI